MRNARIWLLVFAAVGVAGTILSAIMFIMAISFGEFGRMILYFVTALVSLELTVLSIGKYRAKDNKAE